MEKSSVLRGSSHCYSRAYATRHQHTIIEAKYIVNQKLYEIATGCSRGCSSCVESSSFTLSFGWCTYSIGVVRSGANIYKIQLHSSRHRLPHVQKDLTTENTLYYFFTMSTTFFFPLFLRRRPCPRSFRPVLDFFLFTLLPSATIVARNVFTFYGLLIRFLFSGI